MAIKDWPYPFWIAHRGAGRLAPENTLAAFRLGLAHGFRMFECDARLSADGVVVLMHDQTLERTTNGRGDVSNARWEDLASLDAGIWHGTDFRGERIPTLEEVARFCQANSVCLNIEIKAAIESSFEQEAQVAREVARQVQALWRGHDKAPTGPTGPTGPNAATLPLLTSFSVSAVREVQRVAPELPRGLLLEDLNGDWQSQAQQLACQALVFDYRLLDQALVAAVQAMGVRCLAYTVNDPSAMMALKAAGIDGLITDEMTAPSLG
jgi:glycerophosphoryl diester phosphodiesterase